MTVYVLIIELDNNPIEVEVYTSQYDAQDRMLELTREKADKVLHQYDDMVEFEDGVVYLRKEEVRDTLCSNRAVCIIRRDETVESPRISQENIAHIAAIHGRYNIADPGWELEPGSLLYQTWEKLKEQGYDVPCEEWSDECFSLLEKWLQERAVIEPLMIYDHGGISLTIGSKANSWDTSLVGFIIVFRDELVEHNIPGDWREAAEKIIREELEEYNRYLAGDVWCIARYTSFEQYCLDEPEEVFCGYIGQEYALKEAEQYCNKVFVEEETNKRTIKEAFSKSNHRPE